MPSSRVCLGPWCRSLPRATCGPLIGRPFRHQNNPRLAPTSLRIYTAFRRDAQRIIPPKIFRSQLEDAPVQHVITWLKHHHILLIALARPANFSASKHSGTRSPGPHCVRHGDGITYTNGLGPRAKNFTTPAAAPAVEDGRDEKRDAGCPCRGVCCPVEAAASTTTIPRR